MIVKRNRGREWLHWQRRWVAGAQYIGAGMCLPMPVLSAATHTYQTALLRGLGDLDKGAMIRVFEDLLDVQFRAATVDAAVSAA